MAPIDILNGMTPQWINMFPDELISPEMKKQAIDFRFHWVSEKGSDGGPSCLTSGVKIQPTVRKCIRLSLFLALRSRRRPRGVDR